MSIICVAGRKIDTPGRTERFPIRNIESVKKELSRLFNILNPKIMISSGACGADLIAQDTAEQFGITRMMILPFQAEIFKQKSVSDCGGEWTDQFNRLYDSITRKQGLRILENLYDDGHAYRATNHAIVNAALTIKKLQPLASLYAVIIWDCRVYGSEDFSFHFKIQAEQNGFNIIEINTLSPEC